MAYYKKEDVRTYVETNYEEITESGLKPITQLETAIQQIDDNEIVVGFFWMSYTGEDGKVSGLKLEGKAFLRVGDDLYTDDRYALDRRQADLQELSVETIVNDRLREQEQHKKKMTQDWDKLNGAFEEKIAQEKE